MRCLVGIAAVALAAVICAPVLAQQGPLSPIFRTAPEDHVQPPASKAIAGAPIPVQTKPAPAVAKAERDDPVVATAVIPPPLATTPEAAAPAPAIKRQKRPAAQPQPDEVAAKPPDAKSQKQATVPKRYARPRYLPRYTRYYRAWNYGYATAAVTGWGAGRFGPSPYSSTGQ